MIKILLPLILFVSIQAYGKDAVQTYSKVATVHGMVCAFCSSSLEKKFNKEKAVETINVDLKNQKVSVKFKKGESLSNSKLKKMITSSGFKVVSIDDFKQNSSNKNNNEE